MSAVRRLLAITRTYRNMRTAYPGVSRLTTWRFAVARIDAAPMYDLFAKRLNLPKV